MGYVESPTLEPFEVDQISNILIPLTIVNLIPKIEIMNKFLFHLFLGKYIEDFPKLGEVNKLSCFPQPVLNG